MGWVTERPPMAVDLNNCIQCGLCLPVCPTFRLTGRETASPRGRLSAMSAVAGGLPVDEHFAGIMESCLQCRACEVVCPSFLPFGKVMEAARYELNEQQPGTGRRIRRLAVGRVLRSRLILRLLTGGARTIQRFRLTGFVPGRLRTGFKGLRNLTPSGSSIVGLTRPAVGERRGTAAILSGCVMDQWFAGVHEATVEVLARSGYDVVVPENQTCCGALAAHDGWVDDARSMAKVNVVAFESADLIVVDSAGCGAHMKEYDNWVDGGEATAKLVRDITEVVAEAIESGLLPTLPPADRSVAVQDPCHLRHVQRIVDQPRRILTAAGLTVVEIDETGRCCGAAGLFSVLEPDISSLLGIAKADLVNGSGATVVSSANPGCEMQLRSYLGEGFRVAHPVELYAEALAEVSDE